MLENKQMSLVFINIASIIIILAAIHFMAPIISPLLISIFISAISAPAMFWLMKHKIPQVVSITVVLSVVFVTTLLIINVVGASLSEFIADLPQYEKKLHQISLNIVPYANNLGIDFFSEFRDAFDLGTVMGFVGNTFKGVLSTLTNIFFVLLMVVFILIEYASFGNKVRNISQNPTQTMASLQYFSDTLNHYIILKSIMSVLTALLVGVGLYILNMEYILLWVFLVFLLNFIPNIGSIIAAVPVTLLALVQHDFITSVLVVILFFAVNNIVGNMIEPKLMGRKLGLSALVVFVSLVFWGALLGAVGMFLSVPLTMALKIAMQENEKTSWISVLLGSEENKQS